MKNRNIGLVIALLSIFGLAAQADVTTAVVSSADTWIESDAGSHGSDLFMYLYGTVNTSYMGYVRFDLSSLNIDTIVSATLKVTVSGNAPRNDTVTTGRYAPHGLNNIAGNTPQNWSEATLNRSNTGAEVNWATGTLDMAKVTNLDGDVEGITETFVAGEGGGWARGGTLTTTGAPLVDFLNSRVDDNGLVTFILNSEINTDRGYGLVTREELSDLTYRPELTLTYVPGGAYNPYPPDGSTVDINFYNGVYLRRLTWSAAEGTSKWDVWFGAVADVNELDYKTKLTMVQSSNKRYYNIPTTLINQQVYTWVVDSYKGTPLPPEPNLPGVLWRFTASALPIISAHPALQLKFAGETAAFTVSAGSSVPITSFTWYRSTDDKNNTPADDVMVPGDVETGVPGTSASSTLTLTGVAAADEGYYYCVATNASGSSPSNTARLVLKRLYAHWPLNGNAEDFSGNAFHGTLFGAPVFDTGALGQAMVFDGTDDYIREPNGFSDFAAGMTISVWAKPSAASTWARFIDFGNGAPSDNIFFARNSASNDLTLGVHIGTGGSNTVTASNVIALNEWQMFVVTLDESRNVVLYKNGLPVQTGTIPKMPTIIARTSNFVGRSNWEESGDAKYVGLMDDIQLYNYAKSADNIADMYAAIAGNFCRTKPTYDLTGDCKVAMGDFVMLAAQWLECGLYPNCP